MNWLARKCVLLMLLFPLIGSANTTVTWQATEGAADYTTRLNQVSPGAFFASDNHVLIMSTGVDVTVPQQAEPSVFVEAVEQGHHPLLVRWFDASSQSWQQKVSQLSHHLLDSGVVSHPSGVIVMGGHDGNTASTLAYLLHWQAASKTLVKYDLPDLPVDIASPAAAIIDNKIYVYAAEQAHSGYFFRLDISELAFETDSRSVPLSSTSLHWESLPIAGFPKGAAVKLVSQNDGFGTKIYAIAQDWNSSAELATHMWIFDPQAMLWSELDNNGANSDDLTSRLNSLVQLGQSHILALMDSGEIKSYNVITGKWVEYLTYSSDLAFTRNEHRITGLVGTDLDGQLFVLADLNLTPGAPLQILRLNLETEKVDFGWINMSVLVVYLVLVVFVGVFFAWRNHNTDDYFRGGQSIPWWAAACSIYATMLSSLTYVALPAIVYQTNWILLIGIWMIIVVAPVGIYIAIPFFRQIDATSAYEYLSKRFNMGVRLFASALFTLFHIGRMGIVMALTALALSAVTPLTAAESVMLMGVLCLLYCTIGGIEAVIWTDTIQTFVLLIGAVICFVTIISGIDGGFSAYIDIGLSADKFKLVDADFSLNSITTLSLWVIVVGGIGQNLTSYTADQAIVQRYMVTSDIKAAKKSIWANALIAGPASLLFFAIGTGLYAFYYTHPEKLDPLMKIDQIFPAFIATELPVGLAGLIVAGIFAAAQSTVSTSMNSISSTLVTDFIRPFDLIKTEKGYMSAARWITFIMGALGTTAGLIFIDPEIRSLMEAYFKVIGMFMGALGGLFVLGVLTKKAHATGAMVGILSGVVIMVWAWESGWANGYLYATIGICSSFIIGYVVSMLVPGTNKNIEGLTLYTMKLSANENH